MEYLIGLLVAAVGGLVFYRNKSKGLESDARIAETKGRDAELEISQEEVKEEIAKMDAQIDEAIEKRKKNKKAIDDMTLEERAEAANNRYKK